MPTNATEFTFWIGAMAMAAASVFFLLSLDAGGGKWRNSMLVSALITGIAAVHYLYMRDAYASMGGDRCYCIQICGLDFNSSFNVC